MPEISLDGLTKVYEGTVTAVDDVDLDVDEGEFFALLGPSGCGKTTTLRMISGFETPTEGRVAIEGEDVTADPPEERPTNMVFQNLALFSHMDVFDNVAYGLERSGVPDAEIEERVAESLDLVDMAGFEDRRVTELSGGQQQRVALARALTNRTDVLLLDEPLASLDRKLRQQMQLELRTIHEEVGMTFFYVTHDQEAAMTMSDRIAVMNEGEIEQVGPPSEVYDDPANEFVANFIGDVNVFDGRIDDDRFVTEAGTELAVTAPATDVAANPREATLVVRPEKLRIADGDLDAPNALDGVVEDAVFQGPNVLYEVRLDREDRIVSVTAQNRTRTTPYSPGDDVQVGWQPDVAIVYHR